MNKFIWIIVVIVLILAGFLIWGGDKVDEPVPAAPGMVNTPETTATPTSTPTATPMPVPSIKEFLVTGTNFKFSVPEMRVKQGDTVRVIFTSESGMHDWKIDEFAAGTKMLTAGQSETVEFVADKVGTFQYYCSVGQHRQAGMVGELIVE